MGDLERFPISKQKNMRLSIIPLLLLLSFASHGQSNSVVISGGFSLQPYQFDNGTGYNISIGYERKFNKSPLSIGGSITLSNTYAFSTFSYSADRLDFTTGGANYIDYPNGLEKGPSLFPIDNPTFLALDDRGYLKHLRPQEAYFHDVIVDVYLGIPIITRDDLLWNVNIGTGIALSNSSEIIGTYEGPSTVVGTTTGPNAVFLLHKIERTTKHVWANINLSSVLSWKFNENYKLFCRQSIHVTPKSLAIDPFSYSLYMFDLGLKLRLP